MAALSAPAHSIAAGQCVDVFADKQGYAMQIDQTDLAKYAARRTILDRMSKLFSKGVPSTVDLSDPLQRVAVVAENANFKRWFETVDSVANNLDKHIAESGAMVKPVENPQEGLLAKLMMIRQAKHTVDLTYYIFETDSAGLSLLNEIKAAVRRGVRVRVLLDSLGSLSASMKGNAALKALIDDASKNAGYITDDQGRPTAIKATVEIVTFNPVTGETAIARDLARATYNLFVAGLESAGNKKLSPVPLTEWSPNRRTHDKIIGADLMYPDLAMAMVGGRNIADRYFETNPAVTDNFIDYEAIIRNDPSTNVRLTRDGNIGAVVNDYFERLYFHTANRAIGRGIIGRVLGADELQKMDKASDTINQVTQARLQELGEDFNSPEFGQKYFNEGFFPEKVEFINTIHNVLRKKAYRNSELSDHEQKTGNGNALIQGLERAFVDSDRVEKETGVAETVTLISPYLALSDRETRLLKKWLLHNPARKLRIITNSILTTDNLPAQVLVDDTLSPAFVLDEGLKDANGKVIRRSIKDQVTVYAYGHLDAKELGGDRIYPKLHEKGVLFSQAKLSADMTFNQDPRSQLLNSESGFLVRGDNSAALREQHIAKLINDSHVFGSPEWVEIRSKMTGAKKQVIQNEALVFKVLHKLGLWWLI
jgi:putative cardiolipin synthase